MEGSWDNAGDASFKRASGLIDMTPQTEEEMEAIRNAVVAQDGLILSVLDVLRRVPRRVLMVLKLNDLTRYVISSGNESACLIVNVFSGVWIMLWLPLIPTWDVYLWVTNGVLTMRV